MTNFQIPNKSQYPITNDQTKSKKHPVWLLRFDDWSLFGYCILVLGDLPVIRTVDNLDLRFQPISIPLRRANSCISFFFRTAQTRWNIDNDTHQLIPPGPRL